MVSTEEPQMCFNDYAELCRKQQERIDTLEAACQQSVKEIDTLPRSEWALNVVRTLLSHAMESGVRMKTGDLCNVLGYVETGKICSIYVGCDWHDQPCDIAIVEFSQGKHEVMRSEITRSWPPTAEFSGDYQPRTMHIHLTEDEE